jgi:hypothetical protein
VFEIRGVVPGSYDLVGMINDRNSRMSGRLPLEIGSDVQNVTLVVSPGFSLPGRIAFEGQQPAELARMRVVLRPSNPGLPAGGQNAAPIQADGTFSLQQLGPDNYRINIAGLPRNAYIKAARVGGIDVLGSGLQVDRQPTGQLEVLIATDAGSANGSVQNDKQEPSANVTVVLVPDPARRNRSDLYRSVSTDAFGRFSMDGVPPGDYKLFAWEDVENGAWQDSEFIRQYEERGRPVRVSPSGSAGAELRVIPPLM